MIIRKAKERGQSSLGWLDSYHTFSFADYYDPRWRGFRSLRVINDDLVMPGKGFGTHPHQDMEIVTYVLSGLLEHKDSMDNGRVIRAGEVQYMSAGSGVRHSEWNPSEDEATHFLQIWIEPEERGLDPEYADWRPADSEAAKLLLVSRDGRAGSLKIRQDADVYRIRLAPGQAVTHELKAGRGAWVQIATGEARLNGAALATGDGASTEQPGELLLKAAHRTEAILFDLK
ncbi:MAG: pirin family protein [Chthoniobacteraceae bacterium]